MLILINSILSIIGALFSLYFNAKKTLRLSNHDIPIEDRFVNKSGKKQALEAISELVEIPILPESSGGTVVRDWFVMLYRVEKNKSTKLTKQQIALELIKKGDRTYAKSKLSAGSTVPAECLWMIFDEIMRRRRKKTFLYIFLVFYLFISKP